MREGELRITRAAGLLLAAMLILGFAFDMVLMVSTGGPPMIGLGSLSHDLARAGGSSVWPVETWVYTLLTVPSVVFIFGLRRSVGAAQPVLADVAAGAALLFIALHTLHNLVVLAVVQVVAPSAAADAAGAAAVARPLLALAYATFLPGGGLGGVVFILAMAAFAWLQRRSAAGWLALAAAVLFAVGYAQYLLAPAIVAALAGWLCFIAWTVATAVRVSARRVDG